MSDAPQGPGWWIGSDGKWYPPQGTPPPPPTVPAPYPPQYAPPGGPYAPPYSPPAAPYGPAGGPYYPPRARSNGLAVAALVLGIIGVLSGLTVILFVLAFLLGTLALVFGFLARSRAREVGVGQKQATAGVILGFVSLALGAAGVVLIFTVFGSTVRHLKIESGDITVHQRVCSVDSGGGLHASGSLVNNTNDTKLVSVEVDFVDSSGTIVTTAHDFDTVSGNDTGSYSVSDTTTDSSVTEVTCRVIVS